MNSKIRYCLGLILIFFFSLGVFDVDVFASSDLTIYEPSTGEDSLSLYVKGAGDASVTVQVGTSLAEIKSDKQISEAGNYVYSLILVDNSKSIKKNDRVKINDLISTLILGRLPNEKIALATFDDDRIAYLCDYSDDGISLQSALTAIEYEGHKSYLSDILYYFCNDNDVVKEKNIFLRLIVISDGSDHDGGKYTDAELDKVLKEKKIPIYAVCCCEKPNADNIKWFTSISRITDASDFNLTEATDLNVFVRQLQEDSKVRRLEFAPAPELLDGTEKMVKIEAGGSSASQLILMPQKLVDNTKTEPVEENTVTVTEAPEEEKKSTPSPTVAAAKEDNNVKTDNSKNQNNTEEEASSTNYLPFIVAGVAVLLIAIIVVIWLVMGRGKKQYPANVPENPKKEEKEASSGFSTHKLENDAEPEYEESRPDDSGENPLVRLTCITANWEKQFSITDSVVIGRSYEKSGCVLDFDPSISREHCKISRRNGKYYLTNLSNNGTKINDVKVGGDVELVQGAVITLGRTKVKFETVSGGTMGTDMLLY